MWRVERPDMDAGETFIVCISKVKRPPMKLMLTAIRPDVEVAALDYLDKAENGRLHLIPQNNLIGSVPGSEMVKTYVGRMAKKGQPGRTIYDQIKQLPKDDRCPFCDHRNVSTLDHILPKAHYPIFAVTPINLVGCCGDCNDAKQTVFPTSPYDTVLHPYFDDATDQQWLGANVVEQAPAALTFHANEVSEWNADLNARVAYQFNLLELGKLYRSQAACVIADIRYNLQMHFNSGGPDAVRRELELQWESRKANRINSWQTATFEALTESDWFCDGGFAQS